MRIETGDTALVVFSFTSCLAADLPPAAVHRICREAQRFNVAHALSGRLRIDGRRVEQVLEGPWSVAMPLAARILTDPRHGAIAIHAFEPIPGRSHVDWCWSGADLEPVAVAADNLRLLPFVRRPAAAAPVPMAAMEATTGS